MAYNALIGAPSAARDIHIANNDFTWTGDDDVPCCWAEQSLKSVERTLHKACFKRLCDLGVLARVSWGAP